jgi:hypothetical protein
MPPPNSPSNLDSPSQKGDYWTHGIYVDAILPASESDGKVALLAGDGAWPREDGQGIRNWLKYIVSLIPAKHAEISKSMNYADDPEAQRLGAKWRFDPHAFDLDAARTRITAALASPASVPSGPKSPPWATRWRGWASPAEPPRGRITPSSLPTSAAPTPSEEKRAR